MPYAATWTNGTQGRLVGGEHWVRDDDPAELAAAINRRRLLVYLAAQDFSSQIAPLAAVRAATVATQPPPPFRNLRHQFASDIVQPANGLWGGDPPTPESMQWLWPVADADENKPIVFNQPAAGQVGLMQKLNGGLNWTDTPLAGQQSRVRAVHFNELRQAVEWLSRGRWIVPLYPSSGLFSMLPDTPWLGGALANNGYDELRCVGLVVARTTAQPAQGLTNVTVRSASLELTADDACTIEIYRCLRSIDFLNDMPTWNQYRPLADLDWAAAGALGSQDAQFLGALELSANQPGALSNQALAQAVQAMLDGAEQNFTLRRNNISSQGVGFQGRLTIEFDLNSPPN